MPFAIRGRFEGDLMLGIEHHIFDAAVDAVATWAARWTAEAKHNHGYTNRTGNLEASTGNTPVSIDNGVVSVELFALMPYASYVEAMGPEKAFIEPAFAAAGDLESIFDKAVTRKSK